MRSPTEKVDSIALLAPELARTRRPSLTSRWRAGKASTSVSSGLVPLVRLKAMIASLIGFASANWRRRSAVLASMTRDG
jgi:hypothetical protein